MIEKEKIHQLINELKDKNDQIKKDMDEIQNNPHLYSTLFYSHNVLNDVVRKLELLLK